MPFFKRTAFGKALIPFLFAEFMGDYCNCIDLITIAHTQTQKAGVRKTCIKSLVMVHRCQNNLTGLDPEIVLQMLKKKKKKKKKEALSLQTKELFIK